MALYNLQQMRHNLKNVKFIKLICVPRNQTMLFSPCLTRFSDIIRCKSLRTLYSIATQPLVLPKDDTRNLLSKHESEMLNHPDYFSVHNLFTVKDLFDARIHYGHKEGSLNELMLPYIYGSRLGHIIFDLDKTAEYLRAALNCAAHVAYRDGIILFLSRGAQNSHLVEKAALDCGEFSHTRYWRRGVFTNANAQFGAVTRLPDLCIFLNTLDNVLLQNVAVQESAKMLIASVGIVDSNCNPNLITYPVPGNDDSPLAIELYCKLFKAAILRGKTKRKEDVKGGIL